MYTGIVFGTEVVKQITKFDGYHTIKISNKNSFFDETFTGASIAINGVCLTVTNFDGKAVSFDVSDYTWDLTTLKFLTTFDRVNVECSCLTGAENGGHCMYGHIEGVAQIKTVTPIGGSRKIVLSIPDDKLQYFFVKGFIGLHGCSLTINEIDREASTITLNLIPETLLLTNLQYLHPGDFVNYEIDQTTRAIVDTILNSVTGLKVNHVCSLA